MSDEISWGSNYTKRHIGEIVDLKVPPRGEGTVVVPVMDWKDADIVRLRLAAGPVKKS